MPVYNLLATEFSPPNSDYSNSTISAEISGLLRTEVLKAQDKSMSQADSMTALPTYLMEKDERERKERERKDREPLEFERECLKFEERKERNYLELKFR